MKYEVALNGKIYEVDVTETDAAITAVKQAGFAATPVVPSAPAVPAVPVAPVAVQSAAAGEKIVAPMPGNILSVNIAVGQSVKAGDVLFVLEAMKMENDIVAPIDGTVKQIIATKGATVDTDDVLAVI
ncbi:MAG: biotin/lipoyl-binding protein [Clostridia bacterium]|nr:biotin/lipoyl-binding protein [Clostridia bacterium]